VELTTIDKILERLALWIFVLKTFSECPQLCPLLIDAVLVEVG
jgi:hypothetical protein